MLRNCSYKVLVVEDNRADAYMVGEMFAESGLDVQITLALDGREAIGLLDKELPDLVILDLNLPRVDGFEVLRFVKGRYPDRAPRIVVLTGSSHAADRDRAMSMGANAYLNKPVTIEDIDRTAVTLRSILSDGQTC